MNGKTRSFVFAVTAILLWSTVATAFKLSLRYLEPIQLLFYAAVFSCVALCIVLLAKREWRSLRTLSAKQVAMCALLGLLNPVAYYYILLEAYDRLPAQEALSINYSWPIVLTILSSIFLKQVLHKLDLLAIVIAYSGVIVVATHGQPGSLDFSDRFGVGLALGSTVLFASYWLLNMGNRMEITITLFLAFAFAVVLLFIPVLLWHTPQVPDLRGIAGAAYIGFFEMGWTYLLWLGALRSSDNTASISIIAFVAPVISLLFIGLLLNEAILVSTWVGLGLIVGGIGLRTIFAHRYN